jgi:hypothetical protein
MVAFENNETLTKLKNHSKLLETMFLIELSIMIIFEELLEKFS